MLMWKETAKKIQNARIEKSHTQVELAHRINEPLEVIAECESGKKEQNWYVLEKIEKYLKIKL
tara:strand:- start:249 stop:437 length:189 start_codon:yes stop_codon:yes gene_type:complete